MTNVLARRPKSGVNKPRIRMSANDHERLSRLARSAVHSMPEVAEALNDELDRAQVLKPGRHPVDVVCMGCEVLFRDDTSGKTQTVTLVYPEDADISKGKVSVLTPIGAALIGLSAGDAMNWNTRSGDMKRLTVLHVCEPKAASSEASP